MKVTPTGILLLSADAPREDWLNARRGGITATDMPKILGLTDYGTAIDVWREKVAPTDDTFEMGIGENEAALWGVKFEDVVAKTWAEDKGYQVRRIGIIENDKNPWMRASLDRMVTGCPDGRCALEVKTRSAYVGEGWSKAVPKDVAAQVEWQLLVSGLDHIHVIALIGGQRLLEHVIRLSDVNADHLIDHASTVWQAVKTGEPPRMPEAVWTDQYLDQLHKDRAGELELDMATASLVSEYNDLLSVLKDLEAEKAEMKTRLVGALGEFEVGTVNGHQVYSYKSTTTKRLDTKALAEHYPEAAADDRIYNTTTTRTLRTTTKGKKND